MTLSPKYLLSIWAAVSLNTEVEMVLHDSRNTKCYNNR